MIWRASERFFCTSGSYPGSVCRRSCGIPQTPSGKGLHDAADVALTFADDVDKRLAVETQRYCPPHLRIVEGRRIAVDDQVAADAARRHLTNHLRRLAFDI